MDIYIADVLHVYIHSIIITLAISALDLRSISSYS